jgi:hypothetical protein
MNFFALPPVALADRLPTNLPASKFRIGQQVYWHHTQTKDFGCIIGVVYASEASTRAIGYHYVVQLDPSSLSFSDGIVYDWAFEEDLERYTPSVSMGDRPPVHAGAASTCCRKQTDSDCAELPFCPPVAII